MIQSPEVPVAVAGGRRQPDLNRMIDDIGRLVGCESPSADLDALARSATEVAHLGFERLGVAPDRIVVDGCSHLRWRFGSRPRVLLLGHHDTVWPLGSLARNPFEVRDGVLRGPGCFDMKAGIVMAFHALATLAELNDLDGVALLITGDEEIGSATSRHLIEAEARQCIAALVLEASAPGGALKTARKGASFYELQVQGRAAHAGLEPERGINASIEAAHQIMALAALGDPAAGTTVTPTSLTAGTTANTVPGHARIAVDARASSRGEQDRVEAAMRALRPYLPGAQLEVAGGVNRPVFPAAASAQLFARAARIATELGIGPLGGTAVGGGSDGNFTAAMGTPTLDGLGAVGGGAHADDEHVLVSELPRRTALLTALVTELRHADRAGDQGAGAPAGSPAPRPGGNS